MTFDGDIAVDTETKGLRIFDRDKLCVVQLSDGKGNAHVVKVDHDAYDKAVNLKALLSDQSRTFLFHYARFDVAALRIYLNVSITNIYCTKIASKLCRTYTDYHGLKILCKELASVDLSKQQQCSDWGAEHLTKEQVKYAASDVLYLHQLRLRLNEMLIADGRMELAQKCFDFLPVRVELDSKGWNDIDIFEH